MSRLSSDPTFSPFLVSVLLFSSKYLLFPSFLFCFATRNFKMPLIAVKVCKSLIINVNNYGKTNFAAWYISQFGAPYDLKILNLHPRSQCEIAKCAVSVLLLSCFFIRVCWTAWNRGGGGGSATAYYFRRCLKMLIYEQQEHKFNSKKEIHITGIHLYCVVHKRAK